MKGTRKSRFLYVSFRLSSLGSKLSHLKAYQYGRRLYVYLLVVGRCPYPLTILFNYNK